jgi:hypothetical protein
MLEVIWDKIEEQIGYPYTISGDGTATFGKESSHEFKVELIPVVITDSYRGSLGLRTHNKEFLPFDFSDPDTDPAEAIGAISKHIRSLVVEIIHRNLDAR